MTKAFFFDVDGTLLDYRAGITEIPITVREQIRRLKSEGNIVFIASGRPLAFLPNKILNEDFDGVVACNGAVVQFHGKTIWEEACDQNNMRDLVKVFDESGCEYVLETAAESYTRSEFPHMVKFLREFDVNGQLLVEGFELEDILPRIIKGEAMVPPESTEMIRSYLGGKFSFDYDGTGNSFEFYSPTTSKAKGLEKALAYLHIPVENSYAFGDGMNDLEMIEFAGCGVAMGNATEKLKDIADLVCGAVTEDGLAEFLRKL